MLKLCPCPLHYAPPRRNPLLFQLESQSLPQSHSLTQSQAMGRAAQRKIIELKFYIINFTVFLILNSLIFFFNFPKVIFVKS